MFAESVLTILGILSVHTAHAQTMSVSAWPINSLPVAKYAVPVVQGPTKKNFDSLGIETTARAAMVMDVASGAVLYEKDAYEAFPVASLTKLMTAMTLLDKKFNLDEEVIVNAEDVGEEGAIVLKPGDKLTRRELLQALLVGSVNDAGNVLARTSGGRTAFVKAMNQKAAGLRMRQATFVDPTGLNPQNQASAHDVATALRAALLYPEIRDTTKLSKAAITGSVTGKTYQIKSTNLLLSSFLNKDPYRIIAAKTGSLPEARFCMAQATRDREGDEVIAVVLGSENHFARFQDAKSLTYWAFQNFEWPKKPVGTAAK